MYLGTATECILHPVFGARIGRPLARSPSVAPPVVPAGRRRRRRCAGADRGQPPDTDWYGLEDE
jgi:hypothetical protein